MSRTILVVEENASHRDALKATLAGRYNALEATDCDSALTLLRQSPTDIECVLLSLTCDRAFDFPGFTSLRYTSASRARHRHRYAHRRSR